MTLIARVTGQAYTPLWGEKIPFILLGLGCFSFFIVAFTLAYLRYFREDKSWRKLFFITSSFTMAVVVAKYTVYHFVKGYIPDRLLLYALPSPRVENFFWFLLPIIVFGIFLYYRERIEKLPINKFLITLWFTLVLFSLSVAAIRNGIFSIYEPFTRTYWEYTGNLPFVKSVPDFLHNYIILQPKLAQHSITHPPGYTITLYLFQKYFHANLFGLSVLVVILGTSVIFPLYFFLKNFLSEKDLRRGLQLFIFLPSVVLLGATSMEFTLLFFTWLTIYVLYAGWQRSNLISFVGGLLVGLTLFQNFLVLLLTPLFLALLLHVYGKIQPKDRKYFWLRLGYSIIGFLIFFSVLQMEFGYSIITNFLIGRQANAEVVESNWRSVGTYGTYLIMNILAFFIYLGVIHIPWIIRYFKSFFNRHNIWLSLGFLIVLFFLLIGVFQGEIERLWLFITPLFIIPLSSLYRDVEGRQFSGILALLFFQIFITQILFYTYW